MKTKIVKFGLTVIAISAVMLVLHIKSGRISTDLANAQAAEGCSFVLNVAIPPSGMTFVGGTVYDEDTDSQAPIHSTGDMTLPYVHQKVALLYYGCPSITNVILCSVRCAYCPPVLGAPEGGKNGRIYETGYSEYHWIVDGVCTEHCPTIIYACDIGTGAQVCGNGQ